MGGRWIWNHSLAFQDKHFFIGHGAFVVVAIQVLLMTSLSSATVEELCPIAVPSGNSSTGICVCNTIGEIRCHGLEEIPEFIPDGVDYSAIYMGNQQIANVFNGAFRNIRVKKIVLNFNPIGEQVSINALSGLEDILQELHLASCELETLPTGLILNLRRLRVLHAWNNYLEIIPNRFFRRSSNLEQLILWGNRIDNLSGDTFVGLENLRKLDLDRNRISHVSSDIFRHLVKLEVLHLGENRLSHIRENSFRFLGSLKILNLDHNNLGMVLDDTFYGLNNLTSLGLQNNALTELPNNAFEHCSKLNTLFLHDNRLVRLRRHDIDDLRQLHHLDLSRNNLSRLSDDTFWRNKQLRQLLLDQNKFVDDLEACILPRADRPKMRLRVFSLIGNPIRCACAMAWISSLPEKGVDVWGTCKQTNSLVSLVDRSSYESCTDEQKSIESCND